jgi:hypothetical protein
MLGGERGTTGTLFIPVHLSLRLSHDRRMFTIHCENIVRAATRNRVLEHPEAAEMPTLATRLASLLRTGSDQFMLLGSREDSPSRVGNIEDQRRNFRRVHPHMIRRVDDAPKLVDPSGWISEGQAGTMNVPSTHPPYNCESSPPAGRQLSLVQECRSPSQNPSVPHEPRIGRPPKRHW